MNISYNRTPLRIFADYYRPHKKLFLADMFCAAMIAGVDLAFPMMTKYAIERLLPGGKYHFFFIMAALMVFIYILRLGFNYFVTYWGHTVGTYIEADMRRDLFGHLQKLPFSFYDNNRTGKIMSRVTTDLFEVTELAHHGPEDVFISLLTLTGSFILVFTIRWEMALALLVLTPLLIAGAMFSKRAMQRASRKVKERTAEINAALESSISGARVAKAFTNESYETRRFRDGNENYKQARQNYYKTMALFHSRVEFMTNMLTVTIIILGGFLIMRGSMTLAELVACNLFAVAFLQPVRRLQNFAEQFTSGMAGFGRFVEIMRIQPAIEERPGAIELQRVRGDIEYRNVTFSYTPAGAIDTKDTRIDHESPESPASKNAGNSVNATLSSAATPFHEQAARCVLRNVSFSIPAGTTLALVGPSGGGKTTICHLLPRFYDLREGDGAITIDGHDIRDVTLASLRRNIGIVQQEVFLFAGSIRDNIAYGRIGASEEEIVAAAMRAEIHEDILAMPDGYDTLVGERGIKLSGGQKQRVSIARIFLKNPPILILDEATSALDSATELRIQNSLEELARGRTTLIIAHRLSTIRGADRIAVIDDGIQESGAHEELLARGGLYATLHTAQFGHLASAINH